MDVAGEVLDLNLHGWAVLDGIRERLSCIASPMSQQSRLDMLLLQWLLQQWVLSQIQHSQAQIQGSVEVAGELIELIFAERLLIDGGSCLGVYGPFVLFVR